jgi:hypothetical protein
MPRLAGKCSLNYLEILYAVIKAIIDFDKWPKSIGHFLKNAQRVIQTHNNRKCPNIKPTLPSWIPNQFIG